MPRGGMGEELEDSRGDDRIWGEGVTDRHGVVAGRHCRWLGGRAPKARGVPENPRWVVCQGSFRGWLDR